MPVRQVAIGLVCVLAATCASRSGTAALTRDQVQLNRGPAHWAVYVPPGWHVVRFTDAEGGVRAAGIQLSNIRLPAPALVSRSAIQVNGEVLPPRGVGLIIATDTDRSLPHGKVAATPLPLPRPHGRTNGNWAVGSALPHSPIFETLWFRVHGTTYLAAITLGWKASRTAEEALGRIIRSVEPSARAHATSRSPVPRAGPVKLARFLRWGLSFRYPTTWQARRWTEVPSFFTVITYLSPSQLRNPCTRSATASSILVTCGEPMRQLPTGGVLVTWTANGFPGGPHIIKTNSLIGGRPALVTTNVTGGCTHIGGDQAITAEILPSIADDWYTMTACLRAPGERQNERAVRAMLASVRISAS